MGLPANAETYGDAALVLPGQRLVLNIDKNIKTEPPDENDMKIRQEFDDTILEENGLQQCPGCDISFVTKYKLDKHIAAAHGWIKPHPCTMCESSFSSKVGS